MGEESAHKLGEAKPARGARPPGMDRRPLGDRAMLSENKVAEALVCMLQTSADLLPVELCHSKSEELLAPSLPGSTGDEARWCLLLRSSESSARGSNANVRDESIVLDGPFAALLEVALPELKSLRGGATWLWAFSHEESNFVI